MSLYSEKHDLVNELYSLTNRAYTLMENEKNVQHINNSEEDAVDEADNVQEIIFLIDKCDEVIKNIDMTDKKIVQAGAGTNAQDESVMQSIALIIKKIVEMNRELMKFLQQSKDEAMVTIKRNTNEKKVMMLLQQANIYGEM